MSHACKQDQAELNYWFTQDPVPCVQLAELPEELRRRVTICPACREHLQSLRAVMQVLREEQEDPAARLGKSLWPQIQQRLNSQVVVAKEAKSATPGRLLSLERTNVWSQRIALISISVALIAVFSGPLLQFDAGQQASHQNKFNPQYEFARFNQAELSDPGFTNAAGNQQVPIYFGDQSTRIYRDIGYSGSGFNRSESNAKPRFIPIMQDESASFSTSDDWGLLP